MFKTLIFQTVVEDRDSLIPLDMRGDGIQARHIPIILKYIADEDQKTRNQGSMKVNTIWGFEEPENGMELSKAFELADDFLEYTDSIQMFITTHSPAFYGEIIMDYSIHDAIEAGFNKIVFIIRKDIKDAFKEAIGDRIEKICKDLDVEIAYAYQELNELPEGVELPAGRTKPWGTGQAVLACKKVLHEPFAVINADDYYGKEAFVKLHDFLVGYAPEKANQFCMAGFILKNTLSENGAVTRGICETNEEGYLTAVHETSNIVKTPEGAAVDNDGQLTSINAESYASMNMWGLTPEFMQTLEDGFKEFFANMGNKDILKAEYLLPIYIDELLQAGRVSVKVLDTNDKWFGVTYKEDKDYVVKSFAKLIEAGVYQKNLFEDLK